jgi:hypothetical protein
MAKDNWPTPEEVAQAKAAQAPKAEKPKRLQYVGPAYKSKIVLPGFVIPTDPLSWDEDTIRTYIAKHTQLKEYFAEK